MSALHIFFEPNFVPQYSKELMKIFTYLYLSILIQLVFLSVSLGQNIKDVQANKTLYRVDGKSMKAHGSGDVVYKLVGNKIVRQSDSKSLYEFDGKKFSSIENNRTIFLIDGNKIKSAHNGRTMFLIDGGVIKNAQNNKRILEYPLAVSRAFLLVILLEKS